MSHRVLAAVMLIALGVGGLSLTVSGGSFDFLLIGWSGVVHDGPGVAGDTDFIVALVSNGSGIIAWSNGSYRQVWTPNCGISAFEWRDSVVVPIAVKANVTGLESTPYYIGKVVEGVWRLAFIRGDGIHFTELEVPFRGVFWHPAWNLSRVIGLAVTDGCPVRIHRVGSDGFAVIINNSNSALIAFLDGEGHVGGMWNISVDPSKVYLLNPDMPALLAVDNTVYILTPNSVKPLHDIRNPSVDRVAVIGRGVALVNEYLVYDNGTIEQVLPRNIGNTFKIIGNYVLIQGDTGTLVWDSRLKSLIYGTTSPFYMCNRSSLYFYQYYGYSSIYLTSPPVMKPFMTIHYGEPKLYVLHNITPLPAGEYADQLYPTDYCVMGNPLLYVLTSMSYPELGVDIGNRIIPVYLGVPEVSGNISYVMAHMREISSFNYQLYAKQVKVVNGSVFLWNYDNSSLWRVDNYSIVWQSNVKGNVIGALDDDLYLLNGANNTLIIVNISTGEIKAIANLTIINHPSFHIDDAVVRSDGTLDLLIRYGSRVYSMIVKGDTAKIIPRTAIGITYNPVWGGSIIEKNDKLIAIDPYTGTEKTIAPHPLPNDYTAQLVWLSGETLTVGTTLSSWFSNVLPPIVLVDPENHSYALITVPTPHNAVSVARKPALINGQTGYVGYYIRADGTYGVFLRYFDYSHSTVYYADMVVDRDVIDVAFYDNRLYVLSRSDEGVVISVYEVIWP